MQLTERHYFNLEIQDAHDQIAKMEIREQQMATKLQTLQSNCMIKISSFTIFLMIKTSPHTISDWEFITY